MHTHHTNNAFNMSFQLNNLPSNCSISILDIETGLDKFKNVKSIGPDDLSGIYLFNINTRWKNLPFNLENEL